jgi:hypothetical protein
MARQTHPYRKVSLGLLLLFLGLWLKLLIPAGIAWGGLLMHRPVMPSGNLIELILVGLFLLDVGGRFLCFWAPAEPPSILSISTAVVIDVFVMMVLLLNFWTPLFGFLERLKPSVPQWAAPFVSQWGALALLQLGGYVVFLLFLVWLAGHLHRRALVTLARWVFGIFVALIVVALSWIITFVLTGVPGAQTALLVVRVGLSVCGGVALLALSLNRRVSIVLRVVLALIVCVGLFAVFHEGRGFLGMLLNTTTVYVFLMLLLLFLYSGLLFALRAALQDAFRGRFGEAA